MVTSVDLQTLESELPSSHYETDDRDPSLHPSIPPVWSGVEYPAKSPQFGTVLSLRSDGGPDRLAGSYA